MDLPYRQEPALPHEPPDWAPRGDHSRYAFYGGMAGGVLILLAGFIGALVLTLMAVFADVRPAWEVPVLIGLWGLVTGGVVLLAALRVKEAPETAALAGLAMVAGGVLSFFALGGFVLGGLLAILAGVLAIAGSRSLWYARGPRIRHELS